MSSLDDLSRGRGAPFVSDPGRGGSCGLRGLVLCRPRIDVDGTGGERLDGERWLPGGPLVYAAARPAATCLVVGSAVLTAVGGILTAHHAQAGWLDRSADSRIKAALAGHDGLLVAVADIAKPTPGGAPVASGGFAPIAGKSPEGAPPAPPCRPAGGRGAP